MRHSGNGARAGAVVERGAEPNTKNGKAAPELRQITITRKGWAAKRTKPQQGIKCHKKVDGEKCAG
jgi:hypothetical protein